MTPHTGLHAKKSFGQNFLVQRSAVDAILRATLTSSAGTLLEIGPGPGTLTEGLLADGRPLHAVELDPEACALLTERYGDRPNFHLVSGDAVRAAFPTTDSMAVVGNLPYNAATAILTRCLVEDLPIERMVLMFQLEVAQKIMGHPGEKHYGPLSVLAQLCCRVTRLLKLGPQAFKPAPKVESAVLLFEPRMDAPISAHRQVLLDLLHRSFAHRRKTLANNWREFLAPDRVQALMAAVDLPPSIRADSIPPQMWLRILASLSESA